MRERISYLDGLRGLAILLVIGFHAYTRWPEVVPYGNRFAGIPIFEFGWVGVYLFFMISGFVILMTLNKCKCMKEFLYRRWLRLFPGMLICSFFILLTAKYFSSRPAGIPSLVNLLPGLTFIEPSWWRLLIGVPNNILEGSFWSLYVEFKFYVFSAILFYWKGENKFLHSLVIVYCLTIFVFFMNNYIHNFYFSIFVHTLIALSFKYFGWFASGSYFYLFVKTNHAKYFFIAISIALVSSISTTGIGLGAIVSAICISVLFAAATVVKAFQYLLSQSFLLVLGFISYPLYLIHENMMISMIVQLGLFDFGIHPIFLPVIPIVFLMFVSYFFAKYFEVYVRRFIECFNIFSPLKTLRK